ncbi:MAG: emp24/gp25L/p24 family protein [Candidatus Acidiferrum sp.]
MQDKKPVLTFILGIIVAGLVATGIYFWTQTTAARTPSASTTARSVPASAPAAPAFIPMTKSLVSGQLIVRANSDVRYKLEIDTDKMRNPVVSGSFRANGGRGNDIDVFLADEDSFVNLINGHKAPMLYNSRKETIGKLNVPITKSGTYYLCFNNHFSSVTPKQVFADVTLTYEAQSPAPNNP